MLLSQESYNIAFETILISTDSLTEEAAWIWHSHSMRGSSSASSFAAAYQCASGLYACLFKFFDMAPCGGREFLTLVRSCQ
jgi:hypothetical protein